MIHRVVFRGSVYHLNIASYIKMTYALMDFIRDSSYFKNRLNRLTVKIFFYCQFTIMFYQCR